MFVVFADKHGFWMVLGSCLASQVTFSPGTVLFREGDPPEDIYLLVEGEALNGSTRGIVKGSREG